MKAKAVLQVLAVALLLVMGLERRSMSPPPSTELYHQRVKAAAREVPTRIADWVGTEVAASPYAVDMLRPNVFLNRRYVNVTTGEQAELILVQCSDAYDMVHHYPPICYPNQGWILTSAQPRDWIVGGLRMSGMEYKFNMNVLGRASSITVANCMILPDGSTGRDMESVLAVAEDRQRRFYGVAQFQFITNGDLEGERRDAIFTSLIGGHKAVIEAIGQGGSQ